MKKKVLSLILAGAACVTLAACGSTEQTTTTIKETTATTTQETTTTVQETTTSPYAKFIVSEAVCDNEKIKVDFKGLDMNIMLGFLNFNFDVENKQDDGYQFRALLSDVWVNGKQLSSYVFDTINDGETKEIPLSVVWEEVGLDKFDEVQNVKFQLKVTDTKGDDVYMSDLIEYVFD